MHAHVSSFGRNPRASPNFLANPVPKACQRRVVGTCVPRCLGVAHSASSPKAAQALECSLTTRLGISFGRVTCKARAASVPAVPGYAHWVSYCCAAHGLGFVARRLLAFPGLRLGFAACSGFGFGLLLPIPGWGWRFRRVGMGCAFISPFLNSGSRCVRLGVGCRACGGCVRVRMPPLFRLCWLGLAVCVCAWFGT